MFNELFTLKFVTLFEQQVQFNKIKRKNNIKHKISFKQITNLKTITFK